MKKTIQNPREAAFIAIYQSAIEESFVMDSLEKWKEDAKPKQKDFSLAQEISCGSVRMALALDDLAKQLSGRSHLKLKVKERALIHMAIYQDFYMDRIPIYAIVNETVNLAKQHCHQTFVAFLNACLRNLSKTKLTLPQDDSPKSLSIRFSYPLEFVKDLLKNYPLKNVKKILESGNAQPLLTMRFREELPDPSIKPFKNFPPAGILTDPSQLEKYIFSPKVYIQNPTPVLLMHTLAKESSAPQQILDLCASPGGKLLIAHDLYPSALLVANDVSEKKLKRLKENLDKYQVSATLTCAKGEALQFDKTFDLIIVDAPCSNSGVLNKRPEARWRYSRKHLLELTRLQRKLLENARKLLSPDGEVWYMTCSIVPEENEKLVRSICGFKVHKEKLILPDKTGWDGGYACSLLKTDEGFTEA